VERPTSSPHLPSRCPTSSPCRSYTSIIPHRPPFCQYISVPVVLPAEVSTGVVLWLFKPPKGVKKQLQRRPLCRRARCCMVLYFQCNTLSPRRERNDVYVLHFQCSGIQHITRHITSVASCNTRQPASDGHLNMRCCIVLHFRMQQRNTLVLHSVLPVELPVLCLVRIRAHVRASTHAYGIKEIDSYGKKILDRIRLCVL
jgi:hypothetical protein